MGLSALALEARGGRVVDAGAKKSQKGAGREGMVLEIPDYKQIWPKLGGLEW